MREELCRLDEIPASRKLRGWNRSFCRWVDGILSRMDLTGDDAAREKEWFVNLRSAVKEAGTRRVKGSAPWIISCCAARVSNVEYEFF